MPVSPITTYTVCHMYVNSCTSVYWVLIESNIEAFGKGDIQDERGNWNIGEDLISAQYVQDNSKS